MSIEALERFKEMDIQFAVKNTQLFGRGEVYYRVFIPVDLARDGKAYHVDVFLETFETVNLSTDERLVFEGKSRFLRVALDGDFCCEMGAK